MAQPTTPDKILDVTKAAQILALVKENQLITAFVLFFLWQAGAFISAQQYAAGVMC
jgi:hypothetical protein